MSNEERISNKEAQIQLLNEIQSALCSMELRGSGRAWCQRRIEILKIEINNLKNDSQRAKDTPGI